MAEIKGCKSNFSNKVKSIFERMDYGNGVENLSKAEVLKF